MNNANQSQLETKFHQRMLLVYEQAKAELNYHATRFQSLVRSVGGVDAAKQLLSTRHYSEGLTHLWEEGRLDISMEAAVLEKSWRELFTADELETAKLRLTELGYDIPVVRE